MSRQETKQGNIVKSNYEIVLPFSRQTVEFSLKSDGYEAHYQPQLHKPKPYYLEERALLDDYASGREIIGPVVSWIDNKYEATKYKIKGYLPKKTKTYGPSPTYNSIKPVVDYHVPDYRPASTPPNYRPDAVPHQPEYNRPPEYEPNYLPDAPYRPEVEYNNRPPGQYQQEEIYGPNYRPASTPPNYLPDAPYRPEVEYNNRPPPEQYQQEELYGPNYNDWKPSMDAFGGQPDDYYKPIENDEPYQNYQEAEFENNYNGWKPSVDAFGGKPLFWADTLQFNLDNLQNIYINELSNLTPYQY
jgi:hypothetical protein